MVSDSPSSIEETKKKIYSSDAICKYGRSPKRDLGMSLLDQHSHISIFFVSNSYCKRL